MTNPEITKLLAGKGIRATTHRISIAMHVFAKKHHFTAEDIWTWARQNLSKVSRATVYNTLNEFAEAGLLRSLQTSDSTSVIFDSNTGDHFHVYNSDTKELVDMDMSLIKVNPALYSEYDVESIEILVKGRKKSRAR